MTQVIQSGLTLLDYGVKWGTGTSGGVRVYEGLSYSYAVLYKMQPNVRTCVDFLARNVAQLGLHTYRRVSGTDRVRLTAKEHQLARIIKQPNPWTTTYRMIESLMGDLGIYWNAYWLKVLVGDVITLIRIPPGIVTPVGTGNSPSGYKVGYDDGERTYDADVVMHFRGYNPEDARMGLSPLETLRRVLAEEQAMGDYREYFWQNAARMGGIIERPKDAPKWSEDLRKRFVAELQAVHAGAANSGKTMLLEDGMSWKQQTFSAQESEYLAGRKLTREECARQYHIPLPMVGILDHATFCLPAHVLIYAADGPRPIAEVKADDLIWSHDGERFVIKRVIRSGQTGIDFLIRIKTQNRTIETNATHPFLVRRLVRVAGEADPDADRKTRAGQSRWHYEARHVYVPAGELKRGDVLVVLNELPVVGDNAQSIRRMEFYGLYLGDGNMMSNRGKHHGIAISRADDAPYMDYYRDVMTSEFVSFGSSGNGNTREGVPTQPVHLIEGDRQTRFVSVRVAEEFEALGLSGTAHTKRVPGWVFQASREARLAFLRGYLDADGSVDKRGKISYSSCSKDLIEDIRHLCMSLGIAVNNAYHCVRSDIKMPNGTTCDVDQWAITCSDPKANRQIGTHDPRYAERLASARGFDAKGKDYPFARGRRSEPPIGCIYSKVVAVETLYPQAVYDIEVEDTHNFIAAGVLVHNSNIKEQHKNLYQDCLGPWLRMIEQEIELQLLPDLADKEDVYCEFNIQEKLSGSFEEQAASSMSAVGRPWMTVNEWRARQNLPSLPGGDELTTPLNVTTGISAPDEEPKEESDAQFKGGGKRLDPTRMQLRKRYAEKWADVLGRYWKRQGQTIRSRAGDGNVEAATLWTDKARWRKELAEELFKLGIDTAWAWASYVAAWADVSIAQEPMEAYVNEAAERSAGYLTDATVEDTVKALRAEDPKGALETVFDTLVTVTAVAVGISKVTQMANFGSHEGARQSKLKTKTWQVNSVNPRSDHAALNGATVNLDDIFYQTGQRWPGDPAGGAENNANCFPGNTRVMATDVQAAYRRSYVGDIIRITTRDGHELSATPNHPILTVTGWRQAHLLAEGDYIVGCFGSEDIAAVNPNIEHMNTEISEIFNLVAVDGTSKRIAGVIEQFHGDGQDSEVDIVTPHGQLGDTFDPPIVKPLSKNSLPLPDISLAGLLPDGSLSHLDVAAPSTSKGGMSSVSSESPFGGSQSSVTDALSGAVAPGTDASLQQPSPDGAAAAAEESGDGLLRFAGKISADQIVSVERVAFTGHVYNLQTKSGWYIANNIIAHNCQCSVVFQK